MAQQPNSTTTGLPSNGVLTGPSARGPVGGNRKKQKRRDKQASRTQYDQEPQHPAASVQRGQVSQGHGALQNPASYQQPSRPEPEFDEADYTAQEYDPQGEYYSDEDDELAAYSSAQQDMNGSYTNHAATSTSKRKNKKKRRSTQPGLPYGVDPTSILKSAMSQLPLPTPPPPPMSAAALRSVQRSAKQDRIWNTSTQEERERIKEFWLSLSEEERKSLLKIEKEAVLRKMKEQQKHSCSCTVCGRKRTAIELELEVLYDAYYEELEHYANHQSGEPGEVMPPLPRAASQTHPVRAGAVYPPPLNPGHHHHHHHHHHHPPPHHASRVHEITDDGDQEPSEEEEDEEEYSDEDDELYSDEEEYEDEHPPTGIGADFFNFGNSLTVKGRPHLAEMLTTWLGRLNSDPGGILTVADDLLKNDGKKFIEMMEQLAERRMQREQEAEYAASQPSHSHGPNGQEPPLDEDEYEEEEEDYDSQDDYDEEEEEDEMGGMTEEQRMEEGRRMFQIFAARMFEQRVLTAYREKVAAERQQKLLEELEEDERLDAQREAKKAKDAEKKKSKKLAQKQAKAEEKAKKDAEKAAEEAAIKAEGERKQAEQRQKKEEQRKKKDAERKAVEDERLRKEAEKLKRQQEERLRQQEAERKVREQKAQEKKQREEARKKEQDAKDKKTQEEKDQKDQRDKELRLRVERDARELKAQPPQPSQIIKRPSQAGAVAVPPGLHPKPSSSSMASPHIPVATPVVPKVAAAPARARQSSYQDSHGSSPRLASLSSGPSKSTSPSSLTEQQPAITAPKTILQNPQKHQQSAVQTPSQPQPNASWPQPPPPPGMHGQPQNAGFGNLSVGFPPHAGPAPQRQPVPMYPHQAPIGNQLRSFPPSNGAPGHPGMNGLGVMHGRGFPVDGPPGFQQHPMAGMGMPSAPGFGITRDTMPAHSRQQSASDKINMDAPPAVGSAQPISRPTPIQRPSSIRPTSGDMDDLNKHLGSSALLDDADDPLPNPAETRRTSNATSMNRSGPMGFNPPLYTGMPGQNRMESFGNAPNNWSSPTGFAPPPINPGSWGSGLNSSWGANNSGFGSLGAGTRQGGPKRYLTLRLATCQACRQLTRQSGEEYHDSNLVLRQIEANGLLQESPPSIKEIEDICDTEGDAQNGGGTLHVRQDGSAGFSVRYEQDNVTPHTG